MLLPLLSEDPFHFKKADQRRKGGNQAERGNIRTGGYKHQEEGQYSRMYGRGPLYGYLESTAPVHVAQQECQEKVVREQYRNIGAGCAIEQKLADNPAR